MCQLNSCNQLISLSKENSDSTRYVQPSKKAKKHAKISRIPEYSGTGRGDMTDQSAMKFKEINDMIKFIRRFIRN